MNKSHLTEKEKVELINIVINSDFYKNYENQLKAKLLLKEIQ